MTLGKHGVIIKKRRRKTDRVPERKIAVNGLELAGSMNPGSWVKHSYNAAKAAELIAEKSGVLDGKKDITKEQYRFIKEYLEYDDYDRFITLCDALADANGFCLLEKRFVDMSGRYGVSPFTVARRNRTYEYEEYFKNMTGTSIYRLLPGIENCIYD